jgi:REP-associated tyrosine transposase
MSQSLVKVYTHIVFSTKYRKPVLDSDIRPKLYSYLGGIGNKLECFPVKIGGYTDHVHILCYFSKKITIMKLLEELKKSSSKWMKTQGDKYSDFYWQDGYGAFSVNPYEIDIVSKYIENQEQHHKKKTFQDEYRAFLNKYKVDYDERYEWD